LVYHQQHISIHFQYTGVFWRELERFFYGLLGERKPENKMLRILHELKIINLSDRGIPNKERIYLQATTELALGSYLLSIGYPVGNQKIYPAFDQYFWFGNETVSANTWIIVYTGPGEPKVTSMENATKDPVLVLHWGKPETLFADTKLHPFVISFDGILVAEPPELQRRVAQLPPPPISQKF
jgi:hypothetical protein